jgi:hypothetical protein
MRYRLPLELGLTILQLAAPPLVIDSSRDRVDFFIKTSLVHRSFTAWAQERLHDQFLYTYRPRPDEYECLKLRFEAGFGRNRPVRRLYLDLNRLPLGIYAREESLPDSVSATINGRVYEPVSSISGSSNREQVGPTAQGRACEAVAHYVRTSTAQAERWEVCEMITAYCQALDMLWLKLPIIKLDIADLPRESACTWTRISATLALAQADERVLLQHLVYCTLTMTLSMTRGAGSDCFPSQARLCCSCGTSISARTGPNTATPHAT